MANNGSERLANWVECETCEHNRDGYCNTQCHIGSSYSPSLAKAIAMIAEEEESDDVCEDCRIVYSHERDGDSK